MRNNAGFSNNILVLRGGAVFAICVNLLFAFSGPAGAATETVLHVFEGPPDGSVPAVGMIKIGGILYSTTVFGGTGNCLLGNVAGCGTVFSVDSMTGKEKVLYSFQGNAADGYRPEAGLANVGGTLYSTTELGGTGNCSYNGQTVGCGVVFKINPATGAEKVVYSFQATDGYWSEAGLIGVNGTLFGTTTQGARETATGMG
jgi:uncharacterized repeat protein (TIGR03803 family)